MGKKPYQEEDGEGMSPALLGGGGDTRGSGRGAAGGDSVPHEERESGHDGDGEADGQDEGSEPGTAASRPNQFSTATLVTFLLIVLGAGGMYFMYVRTGPRTASAADPTTANASATIKAFLSDGPKNVKLMKQMLSNTEKVVNEFMHYPSTGQMPLSSLKSNPFRYTSSKPVSNEPSADLLKLRREQERQIAVKAVMTLKLQSILLGSGQKTCMINNVLYGEGQQVDNFVVEKISAGAVIVRTGIFRFELRMQK